ncbi:hypothetical protein ACEPAI_8097 [Sanghuangporus weigelae]
MWQDAQNPYAQASQSPYYQPQAHAPTQQPLQFYSPSPGPSEGGYYASSRPSLEGNMGSMGVNAAASGFGGNIQPVGPWWTAFGTGGLEGEPPLLEELGINFSHIWAKSMTVLNPLGRMDEHIMDDADLYGPLIFCFCFATCLLLSGKPQFGYIYGVALLGSASIYTLLNLMSETGIDAYRVASVLGYCLLPMVGVGALSVVMTLDGLLGFILAAISIMWCTYAASGIFVVVLRMSQQRLLVAYPVGLLYGCFALLSVFNNAQPLVPSTCMSTSASPSPGPSLEAGAASKNRHAPSAVEKQRMQLERLLKDPSKPAYIPPPPKEKTIRPPREMMKNVQGSSAGAGSGEFHVYKAARRREYERLKVMDETVQKEMVEREFEQKKRQWEETAEVKTAKNRAKRQKKKEKAKAKSNPSNTGSGGEKVDKGDANSAQTLEDAPLKKRRLVNGEVMVFRKPGEEGEEDESDEDEPGPMPVETSQLISELDHASVGDQAKEIAEAAKIVIHEED